MTQAQRLVRKLCRHCGRNHRLVGEELNRKMDSILAALGVNPPRTAVRKSAIAESLSGSAVG